MKLIVSQFVVKLGVALVILGGAVIVAARAVGATIPDGGEIAFISQNSRIMGVYSIDLNRRVVGNLISNTEQLSSFSWSPNGREIAFTLESKGPYRQVYVTDVNSHNKWILYDKAVLDTVAWSPDGKKIVVTGVSENNVQTVYEIDKRGNSIHQLNLPAYSASANWSPDGKQIAFVSNCFGLCELYVVNTSTNSGKMLANNRVTGFLPIWSPSGEQIAFTAIPNTLPEIYITSVDSGDLKQLATNAQVPTWSPDSKWIAFTSIRSDAFQIYMLDATGNNLEQLTWSQAGAWNPAWRPQP